MPKGAEGSSPSMTLVGASSAGTATPGNPRSAHLSITRQNGSSNAADASAGGIAAEAELDLVLLSETSTPPLLKIADIGKLLYEMEVLRMLLLLLNFTLHSFFSRNSERKKTILH
jgi:hypothetical protein